MYKKEERHKQFRFHPGERDCLIPTEGTIKDGGPSSFHPGARDCLIPTKCIRKKKDISNFVSIPASGIV